jgi:two-component system chemotaxis sensor kinase CheA
MSEQQCAFLQRLRAIFADEAREHLRHIESALAACEQADGAARPGMLDPVLKRLHTLKGAARAADLDHLERLCHALEGVCVAAAGAPGALAAPDFDLLGQAVTLARALAAAPSGRQRNQAAAFTAQLDQMAQRLAGPAPAGAAPAQHTEEAACEEPGAAPVAPGDAGVLPQLVRVRAGQLDEIRAQAEALLGIELGLQHQVDAVRALAAELAEHRRMADNLAAVPTGPELQCARLARELGATGAALSATRKQLMAAVLDTALVPVAEALDELPALVRKLARAGGREVAFGLEGEGVQVDRRIVPLLREALGHLVTNAVDHGIEEPAARAAAGKPAQGSVRVAVSQRGAHHVLVRVSDDGAGLDPDQLADAAQRAGAAVPAQLERMAPRERLGLALRPGVSTRSEVGPLSGRGMGLAIVAEQVAAAGGALAIDSAPGAGSSFELLLPVSLASLRALVVQAGAARYALPLATLEAVRAVRADEVREVDGRETLVVDGLVLPLVRAAALFGSPWQPQADGVALLAGAATNRFALLVDAIVSEQDVLPRRLGPLLRRVPWFSGATQLGDGSLVPVLALDDIGAQALGMAGAAPASAAAQPARCARRVLVVEDSLTSRLLLRHILEGAGCQVETAGDGIEALSRLRHGRFDAVVSDIEMPHMDGLALTERIRADAKTAELPVILVTSLQSPAERERGLHAGADAYLTKGAFDHDQLLAALQRLA